jgi:hypothetical protein
MNTSQRTQAKAKASQIAVYAFSVLTVIGLAGILSGFNGLIVVKLGIEGGQILIDGRNNVISPIENR